MARASIFARASASLRNRSSRRASSSGIDMPSGMSAASGFFAKPKLLIIDELGYLPFEPNAAKKAGVHAPATD